MTVNSGLRGFVIAAPRSGAGKTTVATALMRAFARRGVAVQPFKCGPDYIDPAFHAAAAGRTCFNIDTWAMSRSLIGRLVGEAGRGAELAIAEGAMGLFDGVANGGQSGSGSAADVAAMLGWPVVLVIDVSGQAETAAAVALGCMKYRDDVTVAGVILNRVASERHVALVKAGFERIGMPVLGAFMREDALTLPERHLGLVQAVETGDLDRRLDALAQRAELALDLEAVAGCARGSRQLLDSDVSVDVRLAPPGQRIAVAQDQAFTFFYPHLALQWRQAGAEIRTFAPTADESPPEDADAVWLPGGYPELHAGALAAARRFKDGLKRHAERGTPIHGECGGYMMLGRGLIDADGTRHEMVGLLHLETSFAKRKMNLGYRRARLLSGGALGEAGVELVGHEFHYATTLSSDGEKLAECRDAQGRPVSEGGLRQGSVTGTFFHVIDRVGP